MSQRNILAFSQPARPQWVEVRQLVDEVCAALARQIDDAGIEPAIDVPHGLGTTADREMLRTAIMHLATNALEAMPDGGVLVFTACVGRYGLDLEVADSGPGLSEEALHRAFEPFFTTKRDGAGLGLSVARRIAQAHGGEILAANCPEGGAAFTLRLPYRALESAA
jgi:signal transduction histidine kinase